MCRLSLDAHDVERVRQGFRRAAGRLPRDARRAMEASVAVVQAEVVPRTPVDTGMLRNSITTEVRGRRLDNLMGLIFSPLEYASVVELGRRPGRFPPISALERWGQRKLGVSGLGFVLARAIARRGIKGKHMFEQGWRAAERQVFRLWERVPGAVVNAVVRTGR